MAKNETVTAGTIPFSTISEELRLGAAAGRAFLKRHRDRIGATLNRAGIERTDFTVVSNDCWGQALYEELHLANRTPFVGLGLHADCFLRLLGDLPGYLASPLKFIATSRHESVKRVRMRRGDWPMATLGGDVELHFLHFDTEEQSRRSWNEGLAWVNLDRLAVKFTIDKFGATARHAEQFERLHFDRKLLISGHPHPELSCALHVTNYVDNGAVMFRRSLRHFDCAHWLNTGQILRATPRVLINKAIYARGV